MEDIEVSNDMPSPESSLSTEDDNNKNEDDDSTSAKVSDPTGTGTVNCTQDALNDTTLEGSDDNLRLQESADSVNNSNTDETMHSTEPNILGPNDVSLPKVKTLQIIDSSVTADSPTGPQSPSVESPNKLKHIDGSRVVVDTAAPIESVKDAVSKFGGIVDWKTHKLQTLERCRFIDQELDKTQEEMIECRKRLEAAEDSNIELLTELDRTRKQIDELELQLSSLSSQIQPSNPVKQVIADEFDAAAAAEQELKATVAEHEAALAKLKSLKEELNAQKAVIELTAELLAEKQSLAAAQADYKEVEDQRNAFIVASEQETLNWEREMKQVEYKVEKLNQESLSAKDLKSQLDSASAMLCSLKADLESKIKQETELVLMKKEFQIVKLGIDKAAAEVSLLKVAATSLQSELETEQNGLTVVTARKGIVMAAVHALEAELSMLKSEMASAELKKKESIEKLGDLPSKLQQAAAEADQVKIQKQAIEEELRRAMEEAEQANAELIKSTARLHDAAREEIAVIMASEELTIAAINSIQESETVPTTGDVECANVVTISSEEYQSLNQLAQQAEDQAKTRLAAAFIQLEAAKESELLSLQKLAEVSEELTVTKGAYATATKKSDRASNDKLRVEQELRSWRTKNEQRRKASESRIITTDSAVLHPVLSPRSIKQRKDARKSGKVVATEPLHSMTSPKSAAMVDQSNIEQDSSSDLKLVRRKKRSLLPRLLMFFGKRKPLASKKLL